MDAARFDRLTVLLTSVASRRRALAGLLLALSAPLLAGSEAVAKGKKKKRCRRCRAAGLFCVSGKCVECLSRADCPADQSVCQSFACSGSGACVATNATNGTSCGGENQCRNGSCVAPPVCSGRNDFCDSNGDCCSNDCELDPGPRVNQCNAAPNGGGCKVNFDCASGNCLAFVCV